jgi:hypothetical protein
MSTYARSDPRRILDFLNTQEALSKESAEKMTAELEKEEKMYHPT